MNTTERILSNMSDMGIINNNNWNITSRFISPQRDYIIDLERKRVLWSQDPGVQYTCIFHFKSNIEIPIVDVSLTEDEVWRFLDSCCAFLEYRSEDMVIYFNTDSIRMVDPIFSLSADVVDRQTFSVSEYSRANETIMNRLSFTIDTHSLEDFLDKINYTFLSDFNYTRDYIL
jgi:hypothetical protein